MEEQEGAHILELRDGVVRGSSSLHAFQTLNTNTDVSLTDHVDIVSSIADRQSDSFRILVSHHVDDISLLFGRYATSEDNLGFLNKVDELLLQLRVLENLL